MHNQEGRQDWGDAWQAAGKHLSISDITTILIILTTVAVSRKTQELLKRIGRKGETYDQIINRLYTLAKQQLFYEEQHRILKEEEFIPVDQI